MRQRLLDQQKRSAAVDGHDAVEDFGRHGVDLPAQDPGGIVDETVDFAIGLEGGGDELGWGGRVGKVGDD